MVGPLSQHGRNKIFKIRPHDRESLSSKTELKCRESAASKKSSSGRARESSCRITRSGDQESEQREA